MRRKSRANVTPSALTTVTLYDYFQSVAGEGKPRHAPIPLVDQQRPARRRRRPLRAIGTLARPAPQADRRRIALQVDAPRHRQRPAQLRRHADADVILIEKESGCGRHASGRNSGVLHAGFYYSHDSLKAKFTRLGNERLTGYCERNNIPLNRCGKLVVAKDAGDLSSLDELVKRGRANGIEIQELTEAEAKAVKAPAGVEPKQFAAWTTVARVLLNLDETITRE